MPVHGRHLDDPGRKSGGRFQGLCTEFRRRWSARVTSMGSTSDGPFGPRYLSRTVTLPTYEFMADGARFTLIRRTYTEELQRRAAAEAYFATRLWPSSRVGPSPSFARSRFLLIKAGRAPSSRGLSAGMYKLMPCERGRKIASFLPKLIPTPPCSCLRVHRGTLSFLSRALGYASGMKRVKSI